MNIPLSIILNRVPNFVKAGRKSKILVGNCINMPFPITNTTEINLR